ncbi:unnamed protein product, partial [Discosporangium mesarthrocarpum]
MGSESCKASLVCSMEQGVVQGWVGLDPEEESALVRRYRHQRQVLLAENYRLQCLAQRLLTTFKEAVTVGLEGFMLAVAPT